MFSKGFPNHVGMPLLVVSRSNYQTIIQQTLTTSPIFMRLLSSFCKARIKAKALLAACPRIVFVMLHQLDLPRYCIPSQFPSLSLPFMLKRNLGNHKLKWSISISSLSLGRCYCSWTQTTDFRELSNDRSCLVLHSRVAMQIWQLAKIAASAEESGISFENVSKSRRWLKKGNAGAI